MAGENVNVNIYEVMVVFVVIMEGTSADVISWKAVVAIELKVLQILVGVERYLAVCRPHHYREVQVNEFLHNSFFHPLFNG